MRERGFGRIIFITSNTVWRPPGLVAFLASDAAEAITGQTLGAGGGSVFA